MHENDLVTLGAVLLSVTGLLATTWVFETQQPVTASLVQALALPDNTLVQTRAKIERVAFSIQGTKLWLATPNARTTGFSPDFLDVNENTLVEITGWVRRKKNNPQLELLQVKHLD